MSGYVATELHTGAMNGCWYSEQQAIDCAKRMAKRFPNSEWSVSESPSDLPKYHPLGTAFFNHPETLEKLEALADGTKDDDYFLGLID